MKTLNLKLTGVNSKVIPNIEVDGKNVKCKKNEFGAFEADIQTEKDEVEVVFSRVLELKSRFWWLFALISFIVSIFGLFEPPYDRKCISIDCKFKIKLNETNNVKVIFNRLSKQGKAVEIETENEFEEIKNEYKTDKTAKTRWIILLVIKLLVWLGLAILGGYYLVKTF